MAAFLAGSFGYVLYTLRDIPDPGAIPVLSHSIVIYDRQGREIAQINSQGQYYQPLKIADMGDMNKWATLAAEDRQFYNHPAIDFTRTGSAIASDLLHRGNLQGGSTITQQLAKISVLTPQRSVFRKAQEATIAFGLESRYTKDQVLEMYLNRVSYGHNAYGIGAAAQAYFGAGKQAKDLDPAQAAFLAGIINGPTFYDPATNFDGAKQRQLYVLDGLVKMGKLSQGVADTAAQEDIKGALKYDTALLQSKAPHFTNYVIKQVEQALGSTGMQAPTGIKIYTTLDLNLQNLAQQSVTNGVAKLKGMGVNNSDLLAANPQTGEILAWVGSDDFNNDAIAGQIDMVQTPRQPGSSFKPYVFAAALKDHTITLSTTVHDTATTFSGGYKPLDWDDRFDGDMTARRALLISRNVPAVEVAQKENINNVVQEAHAQGIQSNLNPYLSTAIGASSVTMLEHLQGYQVFADQGTLEPLMAVTKVTDAGDNILMQTTPGQQQGITSPLTKAQSYLVTDTLKGYPGYWKLGWKRQMAGKSGTTDLGNGTNNHPDAWMMAYNPDIVVGAWAGNTAPIDPKNPNQPHSVTAYGVNVGSTVLASFINGLPNNMSDWYKQPTGIVTGTGCPGSLAGNEIYLTGTQNGVNCPAQNQGDNGNGNGNGNQIPTGAGTPTPRRIVPTLPPALLASPAATP